MDFLFLIFNSFFVWFLFVIFVKSDNIFFIRKLSYFFSLIIFLICVVLWLSFDTRIVSFQYCFYYSWSDFLNIYFSGGIDSVSLLFINLTALLIPLCILYSWNQFQYCFRELMLLLLLIEFFLFNFFLCTDLFFFLFFLKVFYFRCFYLLVILVQDNVKYMQVFNFFYIL